MKAKLIPQIIITTLLLLSLCGVRTEKNLPELPAENHLQSIQEESLSQFDTGKGIFGAIVKIIQHCGNTGRHVYAMEYF